MAYSKFKRKDLVEKFGLIFTQKMIFPKEFTLVQPSVRLQEDMEEGLFQPLKNEKGQTEFLITPVLKEVWRNSNRAFAIHSGDNFEVDSQAGFTGECDFIITSDTENLEITAPIITLVEAKKDDFDSGLTQGAAQLYAASLFNRNKGIMLPELWGCTSNGWGWLFFKLEAEKEIHVHSSYFSQDNLPRLLGAWKIVIDSALRQAGKI